MTSIGWPPDSVPFRALVLGEPLEEEVGPVLARGGAGLLEGLEREAGAIEEPRRGALRELRAEAPDVVLGPGGRGLGEPVHSLPAGVPGVGIVRDVGQLVDDRGLKRLAREVAPDEGEGRGGAVATRLVEIGDRAAARVREGHQREVEGRIESAAPLALQVTAVWDGLPEDADHLAPGAGVEVLRHGDRLLQLAREPVVVPDADLEAGGGHVAPAAHVGRRVRAEVGARRGWLGGRGPPADAPARGRVEVVPAAGVEGRYEERIEDLAGGGGEPIPALDHLVERPGIGHLDRGPVELGGQPRVAELGEDPVPKRGLLVDPALLERLRDQVVAGR
jgi:hypothetical protein